MTKTKEILIIGFALFSLFFGAGNLILPPFLGANAGEQWWLVFLGFIMTAVFIPILGVLAHAKVQGTMYDLAKKVAPWFGSLYCVGFLLQVFHFFGLCGALLKSRATFFLRQIGLMLLVVFALRLKQVAPSLVTAILVPG